MDIQNITSKLALSAQWIKNKPLRAAGIMSVVGGVASAGYYFGQASLEDELHTVNIQNKQLTRALKDAQAFPNRNFIQTRNIAKTAGLDPFYFLSIQSLESGFNPRAYNQSSKTCGLVQFYGPTLYEMTYKQAERIGYPHAKEYINRYVAKRDTQNRPIYGYEPVNKEAEKHLKELCFKTDFTLRLASILQIDNIKYLEKRISKVKPNYRANAQDAYNLHFAGRGRGAKILIAFYSNRKNEPVENFFSEKAKQNKSNRALIYRKDKTGNEVSRTVSEYLNFIGKTKGFGKNTAMNGTWGQIKVRMDKKWGFSVTIPTKRPSRPNDQPTQKL